MARTSTVRRKPSLAPAAPAAPLQLQTGRLFVVTRSRAAAWDAALAMDHQAAWSDHAQFMNDLEGSGFVVVGGPLEDTPYIMLAVRAENEAQVRSTLGGDPWEASRIIETTRIAPWALALGAGKL